MQERDFLSLDDLSPDELARLIEDAGEVKARPDAWRHRLGGRHVGLIFEKPSLRTRASFEVAVTSLGGQVLSFTAAEVGIGGREPIEDIGRVLSRYVDAIVMRTFGQDRLERLAHAATVPVVNALSDFSHPCQGLSDVFTITEKKRDPRGRTLAYIGDGNNVAHSLMFGGTKAGMHVRIATPPGYEPFPQVVDRSTELAREGGGSLQVGHDVDEAARGADVLYTDVWASMGDEDTAEDRAGAFMPYQLNARVVDLAAPDVIVMHCLPAHRGDEITADVMDGPRSVVWDQAENRLHAQKALLAWLLS